MAMPGFPSGRVVGVNCWIDLGEVMIHKPMNAHQNGRTVMHKTIVPSSLITPVANSSLSSVSMKVGTGEPQTARSEVADMLTLSSLLNK